MKARILLYDIETSYIIGGVWGIYQTDVVTVLQDWQILCASYKWLDEKKIHVIGQDDFKDYKPGKLNDINVVKKLRDLFDEADIVIAHNGNSFDQKKVVARMMVHHLPPPSPYKQIDTKREMKKVANHTSNKLADLNRQLGLQSKIDSGGIKTWTGCMEGDKKSWDSMKKYNIKDVKALEELYLEERPWMTTHPSLSLLEGMLDACPNCGKGPMIKKGYYFTRVSKVQVWQCKNCKSHPRSRVPEKLERKVEYV